MALAVAVLVLVSSVDGKDRKKGDEKEVLKMAPLFALYILYIFTTIEHLCPQTASSER